MFYVDQPRRTERNEMVRFTRGCNLFADTKKELMEVAEKLELQPSWLIEKPFPHFFITCGGVSKRTGEKYTGKRDLAVELGAKSVVSAVLALRKAGAKIHWRTKLVKSPEPSEKQVRAALKARAKLHKAKPKEASKPKPKKVVEESKKKPVELSDFYAKA